MTYGKNAVTSLSSTPGKFSGIIKDNIRFVIRGLETILGYQEYIDCLIGRVSEWDHHGFYRLRGRRIGENVGIINTYEVVIHHEFSHFNYRGFKNGHVIAYFSWKKPYDVETVVQKIIDRFILSLSNWQIFYFCPPCRIQRLNFNWNGLGTRTWTTKQILPMNIHSCSSIPSWWFDFNVLYENIRALMPFSLSDEDPYDSNQGCEVSVLQEGSVMPYFRMIVLPEVIPNSIFASMFDDDDFSIRDWAPQTSLYMDWIASYEPFENWTVANSTAAPWKWCTFRMYFNELGLAESRMAFQLSETKEVMRWMYHHFIHKVVLQHVENLIFQDPAMSLHWVKDMMSLPDVPLLDCGRSPFYKNDPCESFCQHDTLLQHLHDLSRPRVFANTRV